jgi:hypothetical protein
VPSLYENAIEAIQLGVEDYVANDPRRSSSAVRNFYSGTLLLAKEALRRAAPNADPNIVLAARLKLTPDGDGGVEVEADGHNTLDFSNIGRRLKDFDVEVDMTALQSLNRIRTDIEHSENPHDPDAVREAIARAFPVVSQLFNAIGELPAEALGDEPWGRMLNVAAMHEREHQACLQSFVGVKWSTNFLEGVDRTSPDCGSSLLELAPASAGQTDFQSVSARCRRCGSETEAEALVVHILDRHFEAEAHEAAKGGADTPLHVCPECGVEAYVTSPYEDEHGCQWCGEQLGACAVCGEGLTPENVDWDNSSLCSYHGAQMAKDD